MKHKEIYLLVVKMIEIVLFVFLFILLLIRIPIEKLFLIFLIISIFFFLDFGLFLFYLKIMQNNLNKKPIKNPYETNQKIKVKDNPGKFFLDQLYSWKEKKEFKESIYGLHWGDPDKTEKLTKFKQKFILPFLNSKSVALEIGPGGGRWTKYLLGFKKLYVVDSYQEILEELKKNYNKKNMVFIKNNKTDFPGVPKKSIDFLFSYACFVHLDVVTIDKYLKNISKIVKKNSKICIQYSDKNKKLGRNKSFSENNPSVMRKLVIGNGYEIIDEDTKLLKNSSVILFKLKQIPTYKNLKNPSLLIF